MILFIAGVIIGALAGAPFGIWLFVRAAFGPGRVGRVKS